MEFDNRKYKHQAFNVTVLAGTDRKEVRASLEKGTVKKVLIYTDGTEKANNNMIDLAIKHSTKGYAEEPVNVENYKHPESGYKGAKPVDFYAGESKYLEFTCLKTVVADTTFQVVFAIDQTEV